MEREKFGDINRDGKVDKADLELLRNLIRNRSLFEHLSPEEKKLLDLTGDGDVNYDDVIRLIETIQRHVDNTGAGETEVSHCIRNIRDRLRQS